MLDHREVAAAGPDRAVVFQAPSLFPWLTAAQNVALGVDRVYPHATRAERRDIVDYYLARVGLHDDRNKRAAELSNGMRQRVGIARAFALSPKLLLLDEPFGMLDSPDALGASGVLMEVWARTRVTAICVTHDVDEAILLADRVVMMTNGPNARIGNIMTIDLPRPRTRKALLEHPDYYAYRQRTARLPRRTGRASPDLARQRQERKAGRAGRLRRDSGDVSKARRHRQRHGAGASSRSCSTGARAPSTSRSSAPSRGSTTTASCCRRCSPGEKTFDDIVINDDDWYARARHHARSRASRSSRSTARRRRVTPAGGRDAGYDKLLIATGSDPFIIPVPGDDLPGVVTFRDLDDVDAMLAARASRAARRW